MCFLPDSAKPDPDRADWPDSCRASPSLLLLTRPSESAVRAPNIGVGSVVRVVEADPGVLVPPFGIGIGVSGGEWEMALPVLERS